MSYEKKYYRALSEIDRLRVELRLQNGAKGNVRYTMDSEKAYKQGYLDGAKESAEILATYVESDTRPIMYMREGEAEDGLGKED